MDLRLPTANASSSGTAFTEQFSLNRFDDLPLRATAVDGSEYPGLNIIGNLWNFVKPRRFESRVPDFTSSFKAAGGSKLGLDVYLPRGYAPEKGWPSVLLVHGSAFLFGKRDVSHTRIMANALTKRGIAVAATDYRKIPATHLPWSWAFWRKWRDGNLKHSVDDVTKAVDWIHSHADDWGLDSEHFGLVGLSAGALLSALAAFHREARVAGLVCFYGPSAPDLYGGLFGKLMRFGLYGTSVSAEERRHYHPLTTIYPGPTFLLHGALDTLCSPTQSFKMAHERSRRSLETYLHIEENAGHGYMNDESPVSTRNLGLVADFLDLVFWRGNSLSPGHENPRVLAGQIGEAGRR